MYRSPSAAKSTSRYCVDKSEVILSVLCRNASFQFIGMSAFLITVYWINFDFEIIFILKNLVSSVYRFVYRLRCRTVIVNFACVRLSRTARTLNLQPSKSLSGILAKTSFSVTLPLAESDPSGESFVFLQDAGDCYSSNHHNKRAYQRNDAIFCCFHCFSSVKFIFSSERFSTHITESPELVCTVYFTTELLFCLSASMSTVPQGV